MTIKVKTVADGSRNVAIQITGFLTGTDPFELCKVSDPRVKLTRMQWAVQEKAGLYLWWDQGLQDLVLPVESRNSITFDGLKAPENWEGSLWASPFGIDKPKGFLLIVEFDR